MTDRLSTLYQDLLSGSYDCVDRIVLNAYFRMGHDPGEFRIWWRALTGSDETLENTSATARNRARSASSSGSANAARKTARQVAQDGPENHGPSKSAWFSVSVIDTVAIRADDANSAWSSTR
jgi:hypothetical protein